jgi:hypothetical protein
MCASLEAGETRLRSAHTGRCLLHKLRGKSPCLGAESASGRPQGPSRTTSGEALGRAFVVCLGRLQQHSHAVSAHERAPTERGSLSPCLLLVASTAYFYWCVDQQHVKAHLDVTHRHSLLSYGMSITRKIENLSTLTFSSLIGSCLQAHGLRPVFRKEAAGVLDVLN